ncbi:Cysteine-rich secretory protein LCCL domain-containing 1 [Willisornis vidua]|uniref:Cysteine-rich secretory protein LCCL domain-containing 1 n=1 Tax=Willisornis vidua TaxID=1566151 RepID=A0ABQ9CWT6_9PASS|nr:Cysteine-rich secretory protein LCCL domain-containing 1 [Willisornis vidua]
MVLPNATLLEELLEKYMDEDGEWWIAKQRGKRAITDSDMQSILDLHNKLRGQVYPPASNMEYMQGNPDDDPLSKRYRPPTFHVQAWYDEVRDFTYPYPHECNPYCPYRCSGPVCTHYTQVVWATSSRIGCAINLCHNMNIWGQIWPKAVYLVCNYSPKYECPAGCLDSKAKVIGSVHYEMQSSICKAAIHYGILDNEGGWVDVTRQGRKNYFIKSYRNGVQSIGKYQSANSFTVSKVTVQAITCETTVEQLCPFQKPASHCPRVYCPHNCMQANPHYARVIGTRIYSDISSICRAAVHAGVVRSQGGYVDVMPVEKRKVYVASFQNGIYSESAIYICWKFLCKGAEVDPGDHNNKVKAWWEEKGGYL